MTMNTETSDVTHRAGDNWPTTRVAGNELNPSHDILAYTKAYAREKPEMTALWCFGIGFILGWKLKPW